MWNIRVVTICFCWIVKRHVQTGGDAGGGGARPLAAHEELAEHQAHLTSILGFAITNPLDFWTDTPGDAGPFLIILTINFWLDVRFLLDAKRHVQTWFGPGP